MKEHRYILEQYKGMNTRYHCPGCNDREKTFVRYIDTQTGAYLADHVGKCNRENNCGYNYTPKQYFQDNNISFSKTQPQPYTKRIEAVSLSLTAKSVSYIPVDIFKQSLQSYDANHLVTFLIPIFGFAVTNQLIGRYFLGTSKHWQGATVFWQLDQLGKVRTGKVMLYDPSTGKRVKVPSNRITWAHTILNLPDFNLRQCLFGEHLLKDNTKPVAVVESEKTAVIASVYFPQYVWLASSGADGLSKEKCETLNRHGQRVILFPDISKPQNGKETTFEKWTRIASKYLLRFSVFNLLELKATEAERKQGLDIADYLVKFDYKDFGLKVPQAANKEGDKKNDAQGDKNQETIETAEGAVVALTPFERQMKINKLLDYAKEYNSTRKNAKDKPQKLDHLKIRSEELGLDVKLNGKFAIIQRNGKKVNYNYQYEGNKAKAENYIPISEREQKTQDLFNQLYTLGDICFPEVKGADGKRMSQKQLHRAVTDIITENGTNGAEALLNKIDNTVYTGVIEITDSNSRETRGIPLIDYLDQIYAYQ